MILLMNIFQTTMKAVFTFPNIITSADVVAFLHTQGVHGRWDCDELNLFRTDTLYCDEEYTRLSEICKGFVVNGVQVRGHMVTKQRGLR